MKNCNICQKILTSENIRPWSLYRCIDCFNEKKRSLAKCKTCDKEIPRKLNKKSTRKFSTRPLKFCSIECKIETLFQINEKGCRVPLIASKKIGSDLELIHNKKTINIRKYLFYLVNPPVKYNSKLRAQCGSQSCINLDHLKQIKIRNTITPEISLEIKEKWKDGWSFREIEYYFNVSREAIGKLINGRSRLSSPIINKQNNICIHCNNLHKNIGSNYCSPECIELYLNN